MMWLFSLLLNFLLFARADGLQSPDDTEILSGAGHLRFQTDKKWDYDVMWGPLPEDGIPFSGFLTDEKDSPQQIHLKQGFVYLNGRFKDKKVCGFDPSDDADLAPGPQDNRAGWSLLVTDHAQVAAQSVALLVTARANSVTVYRFPSVRHGVVAVTGMASSKPTGDQALLSSWRCQVVVFDGKGKIKERPRMPKPAEEALIRVISATAEMRRIAPPP